MLNQLRIALSRIVRNDRFAVDPHDSTVRFLVGTKRVSTGIDRWSTAHTYVRRNQGMPAQAQAAVKNEE